MELFFLLAELVVAFVSEILLDIAFESAIQKWAPNKPRQLLFRTRLVLIFIVGSTAGWISTLFYPFLLLQQPEWQILNLVIGPILAGFLGQRVTDALIARKRDRIYHGFWPYFLFMLGFLATRMEIYSRIWAELF